MKIREIVSIVLFVLSVVPIHATIVQKLILKNGSELDGYISMQRPGENFTFTTERAMIYLTDTMVQTIVDYQVKIKDLSESWIKWAEQNDAFVGLGENRTLLLSDIHTGKTTISRVRVLERGAKIKYLEMDNKSYSLNWDTIALIRVDKRGKTALSGIDRTYQLVNGREYSGEYVEEVPGQTLSLYRDKDGVVQVFKTDEVVKYTMHKVNPNQTLFEQSELLDVIKLKKGGLMKGVIIEQNFGNDNDAENYLLLQTEDGATQSVRLMDIEEYRKETNPEYAPVFDILLNPGELVINRQQAHEVKVYESEGYILLPKDSIPSISVKPESLVVIETRFASTYQGQTLNLVKVKKIPGRKKRESFSGFTFEDVVKNEIRPVKVETSINQTTRFEYELKIPGLYVIYNPQNKTAIPFNVI